MAGFLMEISGQCDLSCKFCYRPDDANCDPCRNATIGQSGLDLDGLRKVVANILGTPDAQSLVFIGGEPLLHPGLLSLASWTHQTYPRVRLGVATNGRRLDQQMALGLRQSGVSRVEVALFTLRPDLYQALTGKDGLEAVRRGIRLASGAGLGVTVGVALLNETVEELGELLETAWALGADDIALFRFVGKGRGEHESQRFRVAPEALRSGLAQADNTAQRLGLPVTMASPMAEGEVDRAAYPNLGWGGCGRGLGKWVVDPAGNLLTCELNRVVLGNLLERSVETLVASAPREPCGECMR